MSKKLQFLVIHCTATPPGREVSKEEIILWHTGPKKDGHRGWSRVGYSDLIHLDGLVENLNEYDHDANVDPWEITNGVRGYNGIARHIVYAGGVATNGRTPMDTRTVAQIDTLTHYCHMMIRRYPDILIAGHGDLAAKDCPSFKVSYFLRLIGIPEKNIYQKYNP